MSFRFLHAADIHLDSPLRGLLRRGEAASPFVEASRRALENLVAAAIEEKVAFLIIAGDVFDGDWRDYATGQFFMRQMGQLARAGIRVFTIRGNHDAETVITRALPSPENLHAFSVRAVETVRIEDLRVALHGRGFAHRHVAENVALTYPPAEPGYFNIGILHTSLTGQEGHDVYAPCSVDDLRRAGYDYWALGHIHERQVVAEAPPIVFPGNLQGRHAREAGPKGATLVSVADGRITAMEALTLDAARFDQVVLDLAAVAGRSGFVEKARRAIGEARDRADGRPLALRLVLAGETGLHDGLAAHPEQTREELQALAWEAADDLLIEKVVDTTTAPRGGPGVLAVTGFETALASAAANPAFRAEITATLAGLHAKIPAEALGLMDVGDGISQAVADAAIRAAEELVQAALGGGVAETDSP